MTEANIELFCKGTLFKDHRAYLQTLNRKSRSSRNSPRRRRPLPHHDAAIPSPVPS